MKKFILLSIVLSAFFGDCFSAAMKRKDREESSDEESGYSSTSQNPARRAKKIHELNARELFMLTNIDPLEAESLELINFTLARYVQSGNHVDSIVDAEGRTLLSRVRNVEYASMLVRYGAQVNMPQASPLFYAVTEARENVAYFLIITCGASIESLATHSPLNPSILVLAGGCSVEFRTFIFQYRQHLQALGAQ